MSSALPSAAMIAGAALWIGWNVLRQRAARRTGAEIALLSSRALGPRRSLALVEVLGERLLLGVTDHQVSVLGRFPALADVEATSAPFASLLAPVPAEGQVCHE